VRLVFPGTRGYIKFGTQQHGRHSCMLASYRKKTILVDCGEDWLGHLDELDHPDAVVITHAHPDHAWGLKNGWDRPVWATRESWEVMARYPLPERGEMVPRVPQRIAGMTVEAFPLVHSVRAPAVGLRITAGRAAIFYVPDVIWIADRDEALRGVDLYIGDGASLERGLVRKTGDALVGHAAVSTQLGWCAHTGVKRALITHCGSGIVRDHEAAVAVLQRLAEKRGVQASIATDGLVVDI